jgi:hypothetical protein
VTTGETTSTDTSADEGVQQVPVVINVREVPAAAVDTRDKLLAAIGQEAQHVADKFAGQASTALLGLARAYSLVTTGATESSEAPPTVLVPQGRVSSFASWAASA